eukprot:CAMPEP_0172654438 /NCGR_PEP_ID=MMETSP1068-20121228/244334_1 /TAXON_ID=35684 /ORGANISM="Pseudopedinella elastica, Strain CCMP716" /LENGTH=172 /DNA_ID=CAMNT_0013468883 /DNA_START=43 /DNA_END=558 /DNA_ORIENTATION=-
MSQGTPLWVALSAGSLAGFTQDCVMHPIDTIRARVNILSTGKGANPILSFTIASSDLMRGEGVRGFYRGFSAVLLMSVPTQALYFGSYTYLRQELEKRVRTDGAESSPLTFSQRAAVDLNAGLGAELMASTTWTPYDIVKQRLQVAPQGIGIVDVCGEMFAKKGIRGFYSGW